MRLGCSAPCVHSHAAVFIAAACEDTERQNEGGVVLGILDSRRGASLDGSERASERTRDGNRKSIFVARTNLEGFIVRATRVRDSNSLTASSSTALSGRRAARAERVFRKRAEIESEACYFWKAERTKRDKLIRIWEKSRRERGGFNASTILNISYLVADDEKFSVLYANYELSRIDFLCC